MKALEKLNQQEKEMCMLKHCITVSLHIPNTIQKRAKMCSYILLSLFTLKVLLLDKK